MANNMYIGMWYSDYEPHDGSGNVYRDTMEIYLRDGNIVECTTTDDGEHYTTVLDNLHDISYTFYKLNRQQGEHEHSYFYGIWNDFGFYSEDSKLAMMEYIADKVNDELKSRVSDTWQDVCRDLGVRQDIVAWAFV